MKIKNVPATMQSAHRLNNNKKQLDKTLQQIATGHRLNSAADGAAELSIAERMNSEVRSLNRAGQNVLDGVSMLQTADSAVGQVNDIVSRVRELSVQAANGTLSDDQRQAIQEEAGQLTEELDRISETSEFNGQKLLDGNLDADIQAGPDATDTRNINLSGVSRSELGIDSIDLSTQAGARDAMAKLDAAQQHLSTNRADIGATLNRFATVQSNLSTSAENITSAESRLRDADIAATSSQMVSRRIQVQAGVAVHAYHGLNEQNALQLITGKA